MKTCVTEGCDGTVKATRQDLCPKCRAPELCKVEALYSAELLERLRSRVAELERANRELRKENEALHASEQQRDEGEVRYTEAFDGLWHRIADALEPLGLYSDDGAGFFFETAVEGVEAACSRLTAAQKLIGHPPLVAPAPPSRTPPETLE